MNTQRVDRSYLYLFDNNKMTKTITKISFNDNNDNRDNVID